MKRTRRGHRRRGPISAVALALAVCLFTLGCSKDDPPIAATGPSVTAGSGSTSGSNGATTAPVASAGAVGIKDLAFTPAKLDVKVGETVTWTNLDDFDHFVKSDTGETQTLNSGTMGQNKTYSATFTTAGTYKYHCDIHNSMKGIITVT